MASAATLQIDSNAANKWVAEVTTAGNYLSKFGNIITAFGKVISSISDQLGKFVDFALGLAKTISTVAALFV